MSVLRNFQQYLKTSLRSYVTGTYENLVKRKASILKNVSHKKRLSDVLVSMTTYGPRIHHFEYAILSILAGSILPERILVYVPNGFKSLLNKSNSFLTEVYNSGLVELIEMDEDLGPHSKYYYSFQEFGMDKDIILCDDDVVYYSKWLEELIIAADTNPIFSVFGYKVVNVKVLNQKIAPYDEWIHLFQGDKAINKLLYAEGVGGVYYRRGIMDKEVLNVDVFKELAPKADDVWLWFCTYLSKARIMYVKPSSSRLLYVIPTSQTVNLWSENTVNKRNDIYVENCRKYFLNKYDMNITNYA